MNAIYLVSSLISLIFIFINTCHSFTFSLPSTGEVGVSVDVTWTRASLDPSVFHLCYSATNNMVVGKKLVLNVDAKSEGGTVPILFNETGDFVVGSIESLDAETSNSIHVVSKQPPQSNSTSSTSSQTSSTTSPAGNATLTPTSTSVFTTFSTSPTLSYSDSQGDSTPSPTSSLLGTNYQTVSRAPKLVGSIVGAIGGFLLLLAAAFIVQRRRRLRLEEHEDFSQYTRPHIDERLIVQGEPRTPTTPLKSTIRSVWSRTETKASHRSPVERNQQLEEDSESSVLQSAIVEIERQRVKIACLRGEGSPGSTNLNEGPPDYQSLYSSRS